MVPDYLSEYDQLACLVMCLHQPPSIYAGWRRPARPCPKRTLHDCCPPVSAAAAFAGSVTPNCLRVDCARSVL